MRRRAGVRFAFLAAALAVAAQAVALDRACDDATTQADIDRCAGDGAKKADRELNTTYQRVLREYAKDAAFVAALKRAQIAWLAFRDAQMKALYPGPASDYGSVYPTCAAGELERLTRARTAELQRWLDGAQEGDVCAGSVRLKDGAGDPD